MLEGMFMGLNPQFLASLRQYESVYTGIVYLEGKHLVVKVSTFIMATNTTYESK